MKNILLLIVVIVAVSSCRAVRERVTWHNSNYQPAMMQARLNVDIGRCNAEANNAYPAISYMENPRNRKHSRASYSGVTESGELVYGTIKIDNRRGTYMSRLQAYDRYKNAVRKIRKSKKTYLSSCLSVLGWRTY